MIEAMRTVARRRAADDAASVPAEERPGAGSGPSANRSAAGHKPFAPPVALSAGPLGAVQAADREIARQTALRARAVAEFAASRPAPPRPTGSRANPGR